MRGPSRGLLLSVGLHAAAVILLAVRYEPKRHDLPVVMTFEIVQLTNGAAAETGEELEAPEGEAAPNNRSIDRDDAVADGTSVVEDTGVDAVDSEELHAANTDSPASARERSADLPARETPARADAASAEPSDSDREDAASAEPSDAQPEAAARAEPSDRDVEAADSEPQEASPQAPAEARPEPKPPEAEQAPPERPSPRQRAAESPIELASIVPGAARLSPSPAEQAAPSAATPEPIPEPPPRPLAEPPPRPPNEPSTRPSTEPPTEPSAARARAAPEERPSVEVPEDVKRELTAQVEEWAASKDATEVRPSDLSSPSRHSTEWRHKGHRYVATFEELPAEDSMHLDRVVMSVSTVQDGQHLSTKLELKRLAFSSFAQFVDRWDPEVQIHDDTIDGRFHSNSDIVVAKANGIQPRFLGKVTTAAGIDTSYSAGHVSRKNVFLGGLETRVRRIALPGRFLPFDGKAPEERERIHRFSKDAIIWFYPDGTYTWRYRGKDKGRDDDFEPSSASERRRLPPDAPYYLIAAEKATLYVEGVVNGKVLVYAPRKIVIADDLTYASDPVSNPESDDYLGLVSDGEVEIGVPELTGQGDLRLQASIYARHRFAVRDYLAGGRATLSLYGSLTAGSLTATEPRYRTELAFDRRFEESRPPGFPMADRYEIVEWDGRWTVGGPAEPASPEPALADEPGGARR